MASWALWVLRTLWIGLPLVAGPAFADALDGASEPVQRVASAGLWSLWAAGVVAVLVLRSSTLTAVRVLAPGAALAAVWAAVHGPAGGDDAVAVGWGVATMVFGLWPATADRFVDGSSYGDERRFCLREPVWVLLAGAPLAWALVVVGPVGGALLLAAEQWVAGGAVLVPGVVVALLAGRALHELARRWVVFVPAGFVVHDPLQLQEPVLIPKRIVISFSLAEDDREFEGVDLSAGTPGLVNEAVTDQDVEFGLLDRSRRTSTTAVARRVRFVPARPGAVLTEAKARRFPVR